MRFASRLDKSRIAVRDVKRRIAVTAHAEHTSRQLQGRREGDWPKLIGTFQAYLVLTAFKRVQGLMQMCIA